MFKLFSLLSGLAIGLVSVSVQASNAVIIYSNADTLSAGQLLDEQIIIHLTKKEEVSVAFATGGIQTLKGPYQGEITDPNKGEEEDATLVSQLAQFIQNMKQNIVIRGTQQYDIKLWMVDVNTLDRHYCVPASQQLKLFRPDEESKIASSVLIKHKATGKEVKVAWPARKVTLAWPRSLSLVYGDTYTVTVKSMQGQEHFKMIVLYRLPDSLPTEPHKVLWMAGRGCIPQAEMLLASLR